MEETPGSSFILFFCHVRTQGKDSRQSSAKKTVLTEVNHAGTLASLGV